MKKPGRLDHLAPIFGLLIMLALYGAYKAAPIVIEWIWQ